MPIFSYTAITHKGKDQKGIIDAGNIQTARAKLKSQGIFVKTIHEDREKMERKLFPFLANIVYRIPRKDIGLFVKQLGTLLGAGIPLDKSLSNIIEQIDNPYLQKVITEIKAAITEGQSLSEAMTAHPDIFPSQYPSLVSVGEKTGEYEEVLNRLADLETKNTELKNKIQTAMVYPIIMGSLSLFVSIFLLTVVIPQIVELFNQFEAKLPLITRIIIGVSYVLTNYWWLLILLSIGFVYGFMKYIKSPAGKKNFDNTILKIPIFGTVYKKVLINNFTANLGVLMANRVPLISSLKIVSNIINNSVFKKEIEDSIEKIKEGSSLAESLYGSMILPQMVLGMISAGEVSDQVPEMLGKLTQIYENEVDTAVRSMTQSLEPIMIIFMGGMIFTIMASIMIPMYNLTKQIQN